MASRFSFCNGRFHLIILESLRKFWMGTVQGKIQNLLCITLHCPLKVFRHATFQLISSFSFKKTVHYRKLKNTVQKLSVIGHSSFFALWQLHVWVSMKYLPAHAVVAYILISNSKIYLSVCVDKKWAGKGANGAQLLPSEVGKGERRPRQAPREQHPTAPPLGGTGSPCEVPAEGGFTAEG